MLDCSTWGDAVALQCPSISDTYNLGIEKPRGQVYGRFSCQDPARLRARFDRDLLFKG